MPVIPVKAGTRARALSQSGWIQLSRRKRRSYEDSRIIRFASRHPNRAHHEGGHVIAHALLPRTGRLRRG